MRKSLRNTLVKKNCVRSDATVWSHSDHNRSEGCERTAWFYWSGEDGKQVFKLWEYVEAEEMRKARGVMLRAFAYVLGIILFISK